VKKSGGTAIAVSDAEMMDAILEWARDEALFASPEGAASQAAYKKLIANGFLSTKDKVVLFNTGLGLKYVDVVAEAMGIDAAPKPAKQKPASRNIGGIIGPY
jgi:threonine synthase